MSQRLLDFIRCKQRAWFAEVCGINRSAEGGQVMETLAEMHARHAREIEAIEKPGAPTYSQLIGEVERLTKERDTILATGERLVEKAEALVRERDNYRSLAEAHAEALGDLVYDTLVKPSPASGDVDKDKALDLARRAVKIEQAMIGEVSVEYSRCACGSQYFYQDDAGVVRCSSCKMAKGAKIEREATPEQDVEDLRVQIIALTLERNVVEEALRALVNARKIMAPSDAVYSLDKEFARAQLAIRWYDHTVPRTGGDGGTLSVSAYPPLKVKGWPCPVAECKGITAVYGDPCEAHQERNTEAAKEGMVPPKWDGQPDWLPSPTKEGK